MKKDYSKDARVLLTAIANNLIDRNALVFFDKREIVLVENFLKENVKKNCFCKDTASKGR